MQSYDFWKLNKMYDCKMELGGNDQWSNIIGGVELIRRKEQKPAFGLTFKLLTTSEGIKMGKTMKGAVWLDPEKTSPYEFYQYWRNIEDVKVEEGAEINHAKDVLAFEITKIVHGEEEAKKAQDAARALFADGGKSKDMPTTVYSKAELDEGKDLITLLVETKLAASRSEGRRIILQGGVSVNDVKVTEIDRKFTSADLDADGVLMIKKGKKGYHQIKVD